MLIYKLMLSNRKFKKKLIIIIIVLIIRIIKRGECEILKTLDELKKSVILHFMSFPRY